MKTEKETKFAYNEKVRIIKGFYRGNNAIIQKYNTETKSEKSHYVVWWLDDDLMDGTFVCLTEDKLEAI